MNKIVLDESALSALDALDERVEICDSTGRVIGFFSPRCDASEFEIDDPPSEGELDRIEDEFDGRPLPEIMKDLSARK